MNPEIRELWAKALRSGEYKQGKERLRNGDEYCCLGILCDLAAKAGVGAWDGNEFLIKQGDAVMEVDEQVPPRAVADWADLDARNPLIDQEREIRLAMLNDGSVMLDIPPQTFLQIADVIEAHL